MNSILNMATAQLLARDDTGYAIPRQFRGAEGFKREFRDSEHPMEDQTHHFSGHLSLGINRRALTNHYRNATDNVGDANLGQAAYEVGRKLSGGAQRGHVFGFNNLGAYIRRKFCTAVGRGMTYDEWTRLRAAVFR